MVNTPMFNDAALRWLAVALHCNTRDLELQRLAGSTSSQVYRITVAAHSVAVLRVLDNLEWLTREPFLATHEADALTFADSRGLRVPRLLGHSTADVGFGSPVVLMSFISGAVQLRPPQQSHWLQRLAAELARIHAQVASDFPWRYSSWTDRAAAVTPKWTAYPQLWKEAIVLVHAAPPAYSPVLLHRDYHPTNVLWRDDEISGVVDWINACIGPAGVDVAHCRANLAVMISVDAADEFLIHYQRAAPTFKYQPFWELDSTLDTLLLPGFHPPWGEFGLATISTAEIHQRVDDYLRSIMRRV